MLARMIAAVVAALTAAPAAARADEPGPARATHVAVGVGGYLALSGPSEVGPAVELEVYPASWRRLGARAAYYGFDYELGGALLTAGVLYEAAASRPNLQIGLHADLAATVGDPDGSRVGAGGGVQGQLWVIGPLALGVDATVHVIANRDDLTLVVASATTVRLSF